MVTVSREFENDGLAPHSIPLLGAVNAIKVIVEAMQKERTTGSELLQCANFARPKPHNEQAPVSGVMADTCIRALELNCGIGNAPIIGQICH